ncbi:MAG: 2-oxoacid:acceptor oxidoreductase subunit alpha, partial [Nitrososphaerota archaeon]
DLSKIISPRAYIGSKTISWYTGDEHNDEGHITEEPNMRMKMYEKRMRKMEIMSNEIPEKLKYTFTGDGEDYLIVGWGSIKGVCIDAIRELNRGMGLSGAYLNIKMFSPFPSKKIEEILSRFDKSKIIAIDHSYLSQISKAILVNTGVKIMKEVVKYTGRPIYLNELVEGVLRILEGEDRVVLTYGP